jgi:hypothetical protein
MKQSELMRRRWAENTPDQKKKIVDAMQKTRPLARRGWRYPRPLKKIILTI